MAYASQIRNVEHQLADRFAGLVASYKAARERRRVFRQTLSELNALSPRELADLGIHRSMITRIALEAANGK
ncbi:DUF1127 domain-containing protein [Acidimangrovimonas pyrenivorans]|uniref:DUF1127 domain-containing protein n=1 Tax=Acidimangrovimonas pyrenivorans TaxID=2030798 RepID=A0ABV7AI27_9RHOB